MTRRRDDYELATFTAWRIEAFARAEKLKPLKSYLKQAHATEKKGRAQSAREALAVFSTLAAQGAGVRVERLR